MAHDYTVDGFTVSVGDDTQHTTIYYGEEPYATAQRRSVIDKRGPVWRLFNTNGQQIGAIWFVHDYEKLASIMISRVQKALIRGAI